MTFDARGFAVMRMYLGLVVFVVLCRRFPSRYLYMSGDGLLPSAIDSYSGVRPPPSFVSHLATHEQVDAFFAIGFVVALLFVVGLFTRVMSVALWLVVLSLTNRTYVLIAGGEILIGLITLYAMFAPLAMRFSLDALRRRGGDAPRVRTVVSGTGLVFLAQWAIIYAVTSTAKHGDSWLEGHALSESVRTAYVASSFGSRFVDMPEGVDNFLTWSGLALELTLPFLLLSPFRTRVTRPVAAGLIFLLHFGILLLFDIGIFSYAMWVIVPLLVPSAVYDALEARMTNRPPSVAHHVGGRAVRIARATLVTLVIVGFAEYGAHRASTVGLAYARPAPYAALTRWLSFQQAWGMFAPTAPRLTDALVVAAITAEGEVVDPLQTALSGDVGVRTTVPAHLGPTHLDAMYQHRTQSFDPIERSRLTGLVRLIMRHPETTGRTGDRISRYRITRLFAPTRASLRRDPVPEARRHARALIGEAFSARAPIARVRGHFIHHPERALDGAIARRGTIGSSPLGAIFDSRCGALVFALERPTPVRTIVFSASTAATYHVFAGGRRPLEVLSSETEGHFRTHVLDVPGTTLDAIRVEAVAGPGLAAVSELMVFARPVPGLRERAAREVATDEPIVGLPDVPHYEPLIFGPAVGSVCAGGHRVIPPLRAAETAVPPF